MTATTAASARAMRMSTFNAAHVEMISGETSQKVLDDVSV
jgi:hypothetical protein